MVAAQPLDIRGAEEDEQEARHEGDPGGQQRRDHGRDPGVERAGVVVGAEERDELHDHDQRAGGGLGQGQAADHVAGGQPAVGLDGPLGDIGEHGVGAAEGDQGGAGEEQPLLGEDAAGAGERRPRPGRPARTRAPARRQDAQVRPGAGGSWCSASSGISGGGPSASCRPWPWPAVRMCGRQAAEQPADRGGDRDDQRERHREHGQGDERAPRRTRPGPGGRGRGRPTRQHGLGDDRDDRRGQAGEDGGDGGGVAEARRRSPTGRAARPCRAGRTGCRRPGRRGGR